VTDELANDGTDVDGTPAIVAVRSCPTIDWTDGSGRHSYTVESPVVVGTAPQTDVVLVDRLVSRLHAELELRTDGLWIRDLGSNNGTFVNEVCVLSARVPDGGVIRVGATKMSTRYGQESVPVDLWPEQRFVDLVGKSTCMRELFARIATVARSDIAVLIQGETGSGKGLVASAVHAMSDRAGHPFSIIDCGAAPLRLLGSELFGYTRGAFAGATEDRAGLIEQTNGGTLFLDEIGELPLELQPELLRVLETRAVRRIGETSHRPVDTRLLAATQHNLRELVNDGRFREDLYFRLAAASLYVPPLRDRLEDIPLLVEAFLGSRPSADMSMEMFRELGRRRWRGNVRELRNFVDRVGVLGVGDAPASEASIVPAPPRGLGLTIPDEILSLPLREARDCLTAELERQYLEALLKRTGHRVIAAAGEARVHSSYLRRLLRRHRL